MVSGLFVFVFILKVDGQKGEIPPHPLTWLCTALPCGARIQPQNLVCGEQSCLPECAGEILHEDSLLRFSASKSLVRMPMFLRVRLHFEEAAKLLS